ncbi:hypothetical protein [Lentzea nigeriaca]|nr:hypothetical protein [Lentzea nigeriaca]MBM7860912.1 hypothetical protein [Lentzea nigeriaca]
MAIAVMSEVAMPAAWVALTVLTTRKSQVLGLPPRARTPMALPVM